MSIFENWRSILNDLILPPHNKVSTMIFHGFQSLQQNFSFLVKIFKKGFL